jgi:hypothetical protein
LLLFSAYSGIFCFIKKIILAHPIYPFNRECYSQKPSRQHEPSEPASLTAAEASQRHDRRIHIVCMWYGSALSHAIVSTVQRYRSAVSCWCPVLITYVCPQRRCVASLLNYLFDCLNIKFKVIILISSVLYCSSVERVDKMINLLKRGENEPNYFVTITPSRRGTIVTAVILPL